jgi:hypothetical protein
LADNRGQIKKENDFVSYNTGTKFSTYFSMDIKSPQSTRVHPRSRAEGALGNIRGKEIDDPNDFNDIGGERLVPFFYPPAPPSEWLPLHSIYALVPKPGSVQPAMVCASIRKRVRDSDISIYSDFHGWFELRA